MRAQLMEFTATSCRSRRQEGLIRESGLDQTLAIVEISLDREVVNIVARHRRHLLALHFGDLFVRMENTDINLRGMTAAFERRRAGIARGCTKYKHSLAIAHEYVIKHPAQYLQGEVLEGKGRAVKQFEQVFVLSQWGKRRDFRM